MKILITGGAGFIGSALIRYLIAHTEHHVICVDALTYAANPEALHDVANHPRYQFIHANVCDAGAMQQIFQTHQPEAVMHLAAESHVDNSIRSPDAFIHSNIVGTYTLLEVARQYVEQLSPAKAKQFRFHHVSTD
ncbi:MAG TPA: GDP-mannose 4,6-dehydratase, partial [Paenalcaligenes sp.]|nr:GDP-mannose 4,6-dehydratase [Paenalcaligenes sp.]